MFIRLHYITFNKTNAHETKLIKLSDMMKLNHRRGVELLPLVNALFDGLEKNKSGGIQVNHFEPGCSNESTHLNESMTVCLIVSI